MNTKAKKQLQWIQYKFYSILEFNSVYTENEVNSESQLHVERNRIVRRV